MPLLIVLFAAAALVWATPMIRRGNVLVASALVLLLGTLFGPAFFAIDGPIQFSLDRVLWFAVAGLVAVQWRRGQLQADRMCRVDWIVVALVGWLFLSTLHGKPAPVNEPPLARWLFYVFMPAGMYAYARLSNADQRGLHTLVVGAAGLGIYLSVTAIMEIRGWHGLIFPRYIADPGIWEFFGRGRGPLLNPSGNGVLLAIGWAATATLFLRAGRRGKLLWGIAGLVIGLGVYATLTRSAWMGGLLALGAVVLFRLPRWVRVLGLASILVLGGAMVMGLKDQLLRMKRDENLSASAAEKSVKLRPLLAVVAWEMFQDKPLVGHGFGRYFSASGPYHTDRSYQMPLEEARPYMQHNVLLSLLVDSGLIGLSFFLGWVLVVMLIAWRISRSRDADPDSRDFASLVLATLAAYFINGSFQDVTIIPMINMFLFYAGGHLVSLRRLAPMPKRRPHPALEPMSAPASV
ncbi:MAG: O-antigen ligase family protein [Planctomycetota bacterium]